MLFAILLAALGIAQAQMSFPDISQAAVAIEHVFGTIDRKPAIDIGNEEGGKTALHPQQSAHDEQLRSGCRC